MDCENGNLCIFVLLWQIRFCYAKTLFCVRVHGVREKEQWTPDASDPRPEPKTLSSHPSHLALDKLATIFLDPASQLTTSRVVKGGPSFLPHSISFLR